MKFKSMKDKIKHDNENPFNIFGHGINAYFALIKVLLSTFVLISVL